VAVKRRAQAAPTGVVGKKDGGHLRGSSSRQESRRHLRGSSAQRQDKTRQAEWSYKMHESQQGRIAVAPPPRNEKTKTRDKSPAIVAMTATETETEAQ
jgi:hypothetical protein